MDDSSSSASRAFPPKSELPDLKSDRTPPPLLHSVRSWLRHALGGRNEASLKEMLEEAIEEHEEVAEERLAPEERLMLHNVLSFGEIKVENIMIPRADISAVPHDISKAELMAHITEHRHTRIPVYRDTMDKMLGFLHVKDLLSLPDDKNEFVLAAMLRPLIYVPPSMRVIDLLVMLRQVSNHMAIVVDEYGGTDGLVTMEDVFEEIVGDINDEHDIHLEEPHEEIRRIDENTFEVSARIPIEALQNELGLDFAIDTEESDFDTLGGLLFAQLGRVPVRGEIVRHKGGTRFEVVEADPRRIRKVRILTASPSQ